MMKALISGHAHFAEGMKSAVELITGPQADLHTLTFDEATHLEEYQNTLNDLGASDRTTLMVFNKVDLYREKYFDDYLDENVKVEIMADIKEKFSKQ